MRAWRFSFAFVLVCFSVRCTPDLDALSKEFGAGAGGVGGIHGGGGGVGGTTADGGTSPTSGGSPTSAGGRTSVQGGMPGGGAGGEAGIGGGISPEGGAPTINGGHTGTGGAVAAQGGAPSTGGSAGSPAEGGQGGFPPEGGAGGAGPGPSYPCVDGCGVLYIPFSQSSQKQFFTINLDIANGVDLSKSVLTAKLRPYGFTPSNETIQFYASALPSYNFNGGTTVAVSSLSAGGTMTMDLTNTGSWDHTKVMSFGFLVSAASVPTSVWIVIEEITLTNGGTVGPWLFTQSTDVNESSTVDANFNTANILFANAYQRVDGGHAIWAAPSN